MYKSKRFFCSSAIIRHIQATRKDLTVKRSKIEVTSCDQHRIGPSWSDSIFFIYNRVFRAVTAVVEMEELVC